MSMSFETSSFSPMSRLGMAQAASTTCTRRGGQNPGCRRWGGTHLETTKDVALCVGERLALLEDDRTSNVVVVLPNQSLKPFRERG